MAGIPPVESSEDAFERAAAAGVALKRQFPTSRADERVRDAALIKQAGRLVSAARQVITSNRANGNGHALAPAQAEQSHGLTKTEISALAKGLMTWLGAQFRGMARELGKEFAERDKRIAALEARPVLEDGDVWNERTLYRKGVVVTRDGSAWVCREPNSNAQPGQSDCWRLWVKRGRDGRDAKGSR